MANQTVSLVRICKTTSGWKRYPVALDENGQIKRDRVIAHGRERVYPTGHYEVRYYQGRKTHYDNVGNDPEKALEALQAKSAALQSVQDAVGRAVNEFTQSTGAGTVYLPISLLNRAEKIAHGEGVTLGVWIAAVIGERVGALEGGKKAT